MQTLWIILMAAAVVGQSIVNAAPSAPATTDELVDYVLSNKFYYFDNKATEMEAELEKMIAQIDKSSANYPSGSEKAKVYEVAKHFAEKYLQLFRQHKYKCGIKNVFNSLAPVTSRSILATDDVEVARHWQAHFKMFTDEMENYEKSVEQTHDVIEKFTKRNRNIEQEYHDKYMEKANAKCDLKVFINEVH